MSDATHYIGQRLSLHSYPGSVRYLGKVANKTGDWLGIEWDDARRGKNDGSYDGVRYFECRSRSRTTASFLRPSQPWDQNGNRIAISDNVDKVLEGLRMLSLADTLLHEDELTICLKSFPNIEELIFANSALKTWQTGALPPTLRSINLSHNNIGRLDQITPILALPALQSLNLKDNVISHIAGDDSQGCGLLSTTLQELDLGRNQIDDWNFFNHLLETLPALRSLRVSGNPLYLTLNSAEHKALTAEDGYMLTIARLPTINSLNHSVVREKDRLNAEKYYLNQIALELSESNITDMPSILARHPRWETLCQEYGIPVIRHDQSGDLNPHSLMARLISIRFHFHDSNTSLEWTDELPRALNVYALYGLVGKKLDIMPVNLRLIWETGERDPISHKHDYYGPEWWDSSDDEASPLHETWAMRKVELNPGTRAIGTYLEGRHAKSTSRDAITLCCSCMCVQLLSCARPGYITTVVMMQRCLRSEQSNTEEEKEQEQGQDEREQSKKE